MIDIIKIFSNRELALIFWLLLIFAFFLIKVGKKQFVELLKSFFVINIILALGMMIIYILVIVFGLFKMSFWNIDLLKDTMVWIVSTGFILFMNVSKVKDVKYFKNVLLDNLKAIIILEYISNFYTFSLKIELIILPIMTVLIILKLFTKNSAKTNFEHIKVVKLLNYIISAFGLFIFFFVIYKTFFEYSELLKLINLKLFLLPIILVILTLPFFYFLALFINYEILFVRIRFMFADKKIKNELKKNILFSANISLNKLERININLNRIEIHNNENIEKYVNKISKLK